MAPRRLAWTGVPACLAAVAIAPAALGAAVKAPKVTTVTVTEAPSAAAKFTVTLPKKARGKINVPYRTVDGTAKAGADYTAKRGKLVFKRGQQKKTISIPILDDYADEPNETFTLKVSAVKRRLKAKSATGTIVDNDPPPATQPGGGGGGGDTAGGGGTTPSAETCNGADDDQDGTVDDGVCVVTVSLAGAGSGTVTSNPAGISCPGACSASFAGPVTLTASSAGFAGWSGACSGSSTTCNLGAGEHSVTATFAAPATAGEVVINEFLADPASGTGDANGDGIADVNDDEFVELVNTSAGPRDLGGFTLSDGVQPRHTFPSGTIVGPGCGIVVFAAGAPAGNFGGAIVQTASTGLLALNNAGDVISLHDPTPTVIATHTYGGEGGQDQSMTRDPDATGATFVTHLTATGSIGAYSPGRRVNGTSHC